MRYLDREIARTDRDGIAHALVELAPGEQASFVLDTSAVQHRSLRPRSPLLQFTMPDNDEVALFERPFVVDAPKPSRVAPAVPIHF